MKLGKALLLALSAFILVCILQAWQGGYLSEPPGPASESGKPGSPPPDQEQSPSPKSTDMLARPLQAISLVSSQIVRAIPQKEPESEDFGEALPSGPRLALVIDDFGFSADIAQKIADLGLTATWSIIPDLPDSRAVGNLALKLRQPFLLHLPMQALVDPAGSPEYRIGVDTPTARINALLETWHKDYPQAIGVNNHRGSRATSDRKTMVRFMKALSKTKWGFLDSHTSRKTIAYKVAMEYHIPVMLNRIFIDGSSELPMMKQQLALALKKAQIHGSAVAICHAREKTLPFLEYLAKEDFRPVQFVTLGLLWKEQYAMRGNYNER